MLIVYGCIHSLQVIEWWTRMDEFAAYDRKQKCTKCILSMIISHPTKKITFDCVIFIEPHSMCNFISVNIYSSSWIGNIVSNNNINVNKYWRLAGSLFFSFFSIMYIVTIVYIPLPPAHWRFSLLNRFTWSLYLFLHLSFYLTLYISSKIYYSRIIYEKIVSQRNLINLSIVMTCLIRFIQQFYWFSI